MLREHLSPLQLICLAAALCINAEGTSTQVRCTSAAATSSPRPAGLGGFCVRLRGGEGEGGEGGWGGWRRKVMGQTEQEERTLQAARFESLLDLEGRYSAQTKRHEEERESRIKSVQDGGMTVNFTSPFPAAVFNHEADGADSADARQGGDAGEPSLRAAALDEIDRSLRKLRTSEAPSEAGGPEGKHAERAPLSPGERAAREDGGDAVTVEEHAADEDGSGDSDGGEGREGEIALADFDPMGSVFDMDAGGEYGGEEGGEDGDEVVDGATLERVRKLLSEGAPTMPGAGDMRVPLPTEEPNGEDGQNGGDGEPPMERSPFVVIGEGEGGGGTVLYEHDAPGEDALEGVMRADGRKAPMLNLTLQEDLMDAASQGDTLGVLAAVRAGASLESGAGTPYKLSALHLAAGEGHPGTMGVLLRLGMSADPPGDHAGMTPLHRTCDKGKLDAAALLLSAGADPNAKDGSGRTPVHLAAHGGHTTLLRLLALSGGRTKELDVIRDTPLHLAAMGGHLEACVFLLDEGCRADDLNRFGVCPLELALSSGRAEAVDLLITHLLAHGAPEGYVLSFKMLHKDQDGMPDLEMPAAKQVFAAGRANEVLSGKVPMRTSGKRGWKQFEGRWGYEAQESAGVGSLGEMAADLDRAVEEEDCESVTSRQFWEGGDDSTGPPQDHNPGPPQDPNGPPQDQGRSTAVPGENTRGEAAEDADASGYFP